MSYCTLEENVNGNCPRCEADLKKLKAVADAARIIFERMQHQGWADSYDDGMALGAALAALDEGG